MMFLIAIIVTIFIIGCLYNKRAEREHEERHKREIENLREEAHRLFAAYPDVFYTRFQKSYGLLTEDELYKITSIHEKSWELEQIEIDSKDDERYYKEWRRKQRDFNTLCIKLNKSIFQTWGRYPYDIEEDGKLSNGKFHNEEINIWIQFAHSFCTDCKIDYEILGFRQFDTWQLVNYYQKNPSLLSHDYWDKIIRYIDAIYETNKDLFVILIDELVDDTNSNNLLDKFTYLKAQLDSRYPYSYLQDIKRCDKFWSADKIILIDFIANNDKMKAYCKKAVEAKQISLIQRIRSFSTLSNYSDLNTLGYPLKKAIVVHDHCSSTFRLERTPSITYLSIFKELSSEEMKSLIRAKYKEINDEIKASQEQERRELEEAKNAQMQLQSEIKRINKEYEEGRREYIASNLFKNAVMSWLKPSCANMKCYSMYYYYPTTCDFEVSQYDWDIRNLIWNFKANPLRQMSNETIIKLHEEAVSEIVVDMEKCLKHFFGDDTRYLTLACVPSSKAVINHRRYKDFSEIICEKTHMENGYQYIRITIDGEAKHVGGNNEAIYEIDKEFFKDKNILIFDDVITSGRSMEQLRSRLLEIGANVIGGFSIGITKHEWRANHPIDLIEKDFNR